LQPVLERRDENEIGSRCFVFCAAGAVGVEPSLTATKAVFGRDGFTVFREAKQGQTGTGEKVQSRRRTEKSWERQAGCGEGTSSRARAKVSESEVTCIASQNSRGRGTGRPSLASCKLRRQASAKSRSKSRAPTPPCFFRVRGTWLSALPIRLFARPLGWAGLA
jgi:hypothetical protein